MLGRKASDPGPTRAPMPDPQMPTLWQRLDRSGIPLLAARLILGATFIYMGYKKIGDPVGFLKQVRMYEMIPEGTPFPLNSVAIILPWMEVATGVALLLGLALRGAALIQLVMLVMFTGAIFLRTMHIMKAESTPFLQIAFECGCGSGVVVIWKKLLSNLGLCLLTFIPLLSHSRRFCLGR
jgi:uncharacterized membrane protein YphA (DoxX/SURF4 family)